MTTETTLAALEQELVFAKQLAPGGQTTDPGRVAAIEAQIKSYQKAEKTPAAKPENKSNVSTDYQSHDADAGSTKNKSQPKTRAEHARDAQSKPETADEVEEQPASETADA